MFCYLIFDWAQRVRKNTIIWQNILTDIGIPRLYRFIVRVAAEALTVIKDTTQLCGRHPFEGAAEGCHVSPRTLTNILQTASYLEILVIVPALTSFNRCLPRR